VHGRRSVARFLLGLDGCDGVSRLLLRVTGAMLGLVGAIANQESLRAAETFKNALQQAGQV
jgi:hypothetical protein